MARKCRPPKKWLPWLTVSPTNSGALMAEIYQELKVQHPAVFGDLAFDGRKNLYSPRRLSFERDMQEFQVSLSEGGKVFHVRFTKTHQEIVPE